MEVASTSLRSGLVECLERSLGEARQSLTEYFGESDHLPPTDLGVSREVCFIA